MIYFQSLNYGVCQTQVVFYWLYEDMKVLNEILLLYCFSNLLHDWLQMSLLVPLNCFRVFHSYLHFHWSDMGISFSQFCSYSWKEKQYLHGRISMFTCQMWTRRPVKISAGRIICQSVFHFILWQWDIIDRFLKSGQIIKKK